MFTWSLLADSLSGSRNSCVGVSGTAEDNEEHREADLGPNFWTFFQAVTQSLQWPLKGHQQDGSCLRSLQSFRLLFLPFLVVISPTALSQSSYCFPHYPPSGSTFPTNTNIFIVRSNHFLWGGGGGGGEFDRAQSFTCDWMLVRGDFHTEASSNLVWLLSPKVLKVWLLQKYFGLWMSSQTPSVPRRWREVESWIVAFIFFQFFLTGRRWLGLMTHIYILLPQSSAWCLFQMPDLIRCTFLLCLLSFSLFSLSRSL